MSDNLDSPTVRTQPDFTDLSIAVVGGLAFALLALFLCVTPLSTNVASGRDFVAYWASGQQLVHHADPYDANAMIRIEHPEDAAHPNTLLFMRNPPWALPLAYPLGFVGLRVGAFLWSLLLLGCLAASVEMMRRQLAGSVNRLHWLGYSFAPALICLLMGQTSLFALLGVVLFLRYHLTRPWIAGASLWLCVLKPQLFVPFGIVLVAWVLVSRSYKVLGGAALAMAASCAAAWCMDPSAWTDYSHMMRTSTVETEFIPCLSDALRLWLVPRVIWVQYLPAALSCVWALIYFWQRRRVWNWMEHGNLVLLVSILASPYCWLYDQTLAIPALLRGASLIRSRRSLLAILALANLPVEIELVMGVRVTSALYLWTMPVWFFWYLLACASAAKESSPKLNVLEGVADSQMS